MKLVAISKNRSTEFTAKPLNFIRGPKFFLQLCREFVERSQPRENDIPTLELRVSKAELANPIRARYLFELAGHVAAEAVDPLEDTDQSDFRIVLLDDRAPSKVRPPRHTTLVFAKVQLWV